MLDTLGTDRMMGRGERKLGGNGCTELLALVWLNVSVITFVLVMVPRSVSTPYSDWISRAWNLLTGR